MTLLGTNGSLVPNFRFPKMDKNDGNEEEEEDINNTVDKDQLKRNLNKQ